VLVLVREILPELVSQLVKLSSSDEFEQQEVSRFLYWSVFFIWEVLPDGNAYDRRAVPQVWGKDRGRDRSDFAACGRVA